MAVATAALASETTTYSYDAKGRVTTVTHTGSVNSNVQSTYTFDKADNRTHLTIGSATAPPSFAIAAPAAVTEGGTFNFTVTKSGATTASYSVSYAATGGTAAAGSDYSLTPGTLIFAPGDTVKSIPVVTTDDIAVEPAETVQITLSAPTGGATITTASATGTINDNDTAPPANNPPVANPDSVTVAHCGFVSKNVVANDTDPDGDPLTLLSGLSGSAAGFSAANPPTNIDINAPGSGGSYSVTYTIQDSHGATATGTLSISVTGSGVCP